MITLREVAAEHGQALERCRVLEPFGDHLQSEIVAEVDGRAHDDLQLERVVEVGSLDEAIELVNASRYGNGTSIFTESGGAARRYRAEVQAGMVGVNVGVAAPVAFFPFSGWKASFLGDLHAHGQDAIEFFTRKKTITSRWFSVGESGPFFVE